MARFSDDDQRRLRCSPTMTSTVLINTFFPVVQLALWLLLQLIQSFKGVRFNSGLVHKINQIMSLDIMLIRIISRLKNVKIVENVLILKY